MINIQKARTAFQKFLNRYNDKSELGCNLSTRSCSESGYSWLNSKGSVYYWVGSASRSNLLWCVNNSGTLFDIVGPGNSYAVRPVVTISTSEISFQ